MTLLDALTAAADREGRITPDRIPGAVSAAHLTATQAAHELQDLMAIGAINKTGDIYTISH